MNVFVLPVKSRRSRNITLVSSLRHTFFLSVCLNEFLAIFTESVVELVLPCCLYVPYFLISSVYMTRTSSRGYIDNCMNLLKTNFKALQIAARKLI